MSTYMIIRHGHCARRTCWDWLVSLVAITHSARVSGLDQSVTSLLSSRWQAGNHSAFWGMTLDEGIRYRLGTIRPSSSVMNMNEIYVSLFLTTFLLSISQRLSTWG